MHLLTAAMALPDATDRFEEDERQREAAELKAAEDQAWLDKAKTTGTKYGVRRFDASGLNAYTALPPVSGAGLVVPKRKHADNAEASEAVAEQASEAAGRYLSVQLGAPRAPNI